MTTQPSQPEVKVWDLPTRAFHWLLVVLAVISYLTAEEAMTIHMWSGALIFTLVATRILWGFIGSTTSRFSSFVKKPRQVIDYAQQLRPGFAPSVFGHTPTGGWVIVAMLGLMLAMPMAGVFGNDDVTFRGPLAYLVDKSTSNMLTGVHEVLFNILMALIILHVAAIAVYRYILKEDLVRPMIFGVRPWRGPVPATRFASPIIAVALWLAIAALVYFYVLK